MSERPNATAAGPEAAERELLRRLIAGPVSGDALARACGQTRAAVWKRIQALRAAGVAIVARAGLGYQLVHPVELLDAARILDALPPGVRGEVAELAVRWSVASTSSELLAAPPGPGVRVLLAERQTGGRGRRGRGWASPLAANLYLSLARGFESGLARLPGVSLVAGVAATEALHSLGVAGVRLKWPNDLVVAAADGRLRKLGGILVEGGGEHAGPVRAVIGIGLNVRMPAATEIDQPWIDLAALADGAPPSRNALAAALLARLLPALDAFDRDGLEPFQERYARWDALRDAEVVVHAGREAHVGRMLGLAGDGALRVALPGGERRFHAGEVSLRAGVPE